MITPHKTHMKPWPRIQLTPQGSTDWSCLPGDKILHQLVTIGTYEKPSTIIGNYGNYW